MRLVLECFSCMCVVVASCRDERHMMRIMRLWCESIWNDEKPDDDGDAEVGGR